MRKFIVIIPILIVILPALFAQGLSPDECRNIQPEGINSELYSWYSEIIQGMTNIHDINYEEAAELSNLLGQMDSMIAKYGSESDQRKVENMSECLESYRNIIRIKVDVLSRSSNTVVLPKPDTGKISDEETIPEDTIEDEYASSEPQPPALPVDYDSDIPEYYKGGEDYTISESNFRTTEIYPLIDQNQGTTLDSATFSYINSKILLMKSRNDSLREIISEKNERILKEAVNVYDSMLVYQNKISELNRKLEEFTRDSIRNSRMIVEYEESLMIFKNRADNLKKDNESLWNKIANNVTEITGLNNRIDSLELIVSLLDRELMFKESKLQKITPYSSAESFLKLALRSDSRAKNDDYLEDGSINLGGLGLHFKKKNLFGQNSFRSIDLRSEVNIFETDTKADFYVGGGIYMYPWMLPWMPYAIRGSKSVIDSTDFFIGMSYYYKSGFDYFDQENKEAISFKLGMESYIHYINTELRWYSTIFQEDYEYNVASFGIQHRILKRPEPDYVNPETFRPSSRFSRHGNKAEVIAESEREKDEPKKDSNILMTFELFASYVQNGGLSVPYNDNYDSFLLLEPKKSEKTYIGGGLTWGGNAFSYLPNLHNRLADNGRFDIMDVFPIHIDNIQMFGLYTYGNIDKEGKFKNFTADAFYHLPSIPIFKTPMLFRLAFYNDAPAKWLTTSMASINNDTWDFVPSDSLNPINFTDDIVPKQYIDMEVWLMFESIPLGITASLPQPLDEFPIEVSVETFFNLR